ncbi:MAG: ABC transporter substrate-binding protein [Oscillospiraceae bacterium]|nr:ABC transporter substrate-binding protein [Oscillospiraceae bacterium]
MKKTLAIVLSLLMLVGLLAGCGSTEAKNEASASTAETTAPAETETPAEESAPAEEEAAAEAPTEAPVYKVGIVNYVDDASLNQIVNNLEAELDAKGAELGVTFDYEPYYDNAQADPAVLNQIGADLVADEVDIIVAIATPTAMTMVSATEDTDIPVVFAAVSDPVGAKLVASMDAPGGKVTGTSDGLDAQALINLMTAASPELKKVGLLYDTAQDSSKAAIESAKTILDGMNIQYVEKTGSTTDEVLMAAQALVAEGVEAVFTPTDNTVMAAEQAIYEVFVDAKIPHYTGADSFALWGAFAGYGVDYAVLGTATGDIVVDILVNNADPAAYGVVTFNNGIVSVNTETCEAIGFDLETIKSAFGEIATEFRELTTQAEFDN